MNIWGTFDAHRILRTLITFWGIEVSLDIFCGPLRTSMAMMSFWGIWGHFEDQLKTRCLRTLGTFCAFSWLIEDFADFLRTFWRPVDTRILKTLKNLSGTFDDFLWTNWGPVFRKFWGLCEDLFRTIWGIFDDHRILRTLTYVLRNGDRFGYLLWTSDDFEGFDDLLRTLWTTLSIFWGPEAWGRWGPFCAFSWPFEDFVDFFEDFLKTWGPEYLSERWRIFLGLLRTSCGPFEDVF